MRIVEISGTVNLNGDISYNVSSNVDLPELDAIGKVELLYDVGAIDEVERIEKYIEIYEDTLNKMVGLRRLRQFGSPLNILVL